MKYFIKVYNDRQFRLYSTITKDKGNIIKNVNNGNNNSENASLSRTKRNIREICLCNNFEYFCTWTVDSKLCDRFSLTATQELMHKTLKAYKRKNASFKFIFITEKHKNGAFHFHGLIKGVNPQDLTLNKNNYLDFPFFSTRVGFFSCSKIRDYAKTCNYICKYITKSCIKNEHNQIYFCSRGLKKASKEQLKNFDYLEFCKYFNDFSYRDNYTQVIDLDFTKLTQEQLLFLMHL